jgi:hypothetical protein
LRLHPKGGQLEQAAVRRSEAHSHGNLARIGRIPVVACDGQAALKQAIERHFGQVEERAARREGRRLLRAD